MSMSAALRFAMTRTRLARGYMLGAAMLVACGSPAFAEDEAPKVLPTAPGVSLHFQSTFTPQGNFAFRAPYSGDQSLDPSGQAVETWTMTGYFGARLWNGGEFYFNPETFHGFGLRSPDGSKGSVGLAGFANGEAQKGGRWDMDLAVARVYFSQTVGLGGEQETIKDDLNQIAGKKDISRLTFTFGKLAVGDIFDNNTYAHDPRTQFLNWSIWEAGAFDYAADVKGYTVGGIVDFNQKDWALRAGYFLVPVKPNALALDGDIAQRGSAVVEFEKRYNLFAQPGKLRLLGFENTVFAGNYAEAVALSPSAANIEATRKTRTNYGFAINLEQAITADLGAFFRYSRNGGKVEICCFTDINESISGGLSLKGAAWGRPSDTVGVGAAFNMLSRDAQKYFAAGGSGLLIGDGTLTYKGEQIVETYYSYAATDTLTLTGDYQFIGNPAYNSDRGPVHVLAGRVHLQF